MRQEIIRDKLLLFFITLIILLLVFTCVSASGNEPAENDHKTALLSVFKLPASLRVIQDEAFESTALVIADLSETTVERIGERAFANIPTLTGIKLPMQIGSIAKTTFSGSCHVTLTGAPRGYTRTWAKENGIPFAPIATFTANTRTVQSISLSMHRFNPIQTGLSTDNEAKDGKDQTRKTIGEIKDNRCQEGVAYHLQGRAPPAWG